MQHGVLVTGGGGCEADRDDTGRVAVGQVRGGAPVVLDGERTGGSGDRHRADIERARAGVADRLKVVVLVAGAHGEGPEVLAGRVDGRDRGRGDGCLAGAGQVRADARGIGGHVQHGVLVTGAGGCEADRDDTGRVAVGQVRGGAPVVLDGERTGGSGDGHRADIERARAGVGDR